MNLLLAQAEAAPVDTTLLVVGAVVVVAILLVVLLLARRGKKRALEQREEKELPPSRVSIEVSRAEAELERVRREREEAERKAKAEQVAHEEKQAEARRRAEEESRRVVEAEARAAELRKAAKEAATDEERKKAREEAERAEAEAARRRKEAEEAERKAAYEAKKAGEVDQKTRRKLEEEAQKTQALEAAKAKAEAEAAAERARQRKIEAEAGRTLAEGLAKTRGGFMARIAELVGASSTLDEKFLAELEEILFTADIGVKTANRLMELVREKLKKKELANPQKVRQALREEIENILTLGGTFHEGGMPAPKENPQVVMVVGVNGSGKTTTIGKLAFKSRVSGRDVILGAGDTFRAAAAEQLDVWASRAEVPLIRSDEGSDPAAVCFDAVKKAVDEGKDLCILDTAGRLHTKAPLMEELKKVKRVVAKAQATAPHETWLVVDGTTGQNALHQARLFHEAINLTGIVLTKLDGTAKGGVVIGICDELKVPVRFVGVGEKIGDLRPFSPKEFVEALFAEGA